VRTLATVLAVSLSMIAAAAQAQPADLPISASRSGPLPAGIKVGRIGGKAYYLDSRGRLLYGMDMRVLLPFGPDPAQHCTGDCAATWEPVLAPAGARPNIAFPQGFGGKAPPPPPPGFITQPQSAPDWTIIAGPQGPQWVFKGWHMVFIRRADSRSNRYDGAEERAWNTLKFVAPPPAFVAPGDVQAVAVDGGYVLADGAGRHLFTGVCRRDCASWQPYRGGMASAAVGPWQVARDGDVPQWTRGGQPVFVAAPETPGEVPAGARELRP